MSPRTRSRAPLVLTLALAVCVLAATSATARAGSAPGAAGTIWHVDANAPAGGDGSSAAPFQDLRSAFDVAGDGDTVLVRDGLYVGPRNRGLDTEGRSLAIRSVNGAAATVVDCGGAGRFLAGVVGPASILRLEGLTIFRAVKGGPPPTFFGGGLALAGSGDVEVRGCVFRECFAFGSGSAIASSVPLRLVDCTFERNQTGLSGGGVPLAGGTVALPSGSSVESCDFIANWSRRGAALLGNLAGAPVLVSRSRFLGNRAFFGGGALTGRFVVDQCLFVGNRARDDGGAIEVEGGLELTGSTLVLNHAERAGGALSGTGVRVRNSILVRNTSLAGGSQIAAFGAGTVEVQRCDVEGGPSAVLVAAGASLVWGAGNLDLAPGFVDPLGPDGDPLSFLDNDYRLGAGSPCVDAGDNALVAPDLLDLDGDGDVMEPVPFDLDGNPRFRDDPQVPDTGSGTPPLVDMGAYERQP